MTNEEIIKKSIEIAINRGWRPLPKSICTPDTILANVYHQSAAIFFNHGFAKAFWGEDIIGWTPAEDDRIAWQYHLQKMVLEEDPIKYLAKFI